MQKNDYSPYKLIFYLKIPRVLRNAHKNFFTLTTLHCLFESHQDKPVELNPTHHNQPIHSL